MFYQALLIQTRSWIDLTVIYTYYHSFLTTYCYFSLLIQVNSVSCLCFIDILLDTDHFLQYQLLTPLNIVQLQILSTELLTIIPLSIIQMLHNPELWCTRSFVSLSDKKYIPSFTSWQRNTLNILITSLLAFFKHSVISCLLHVVTISWL